jgi:hypothetical protein
MSRAASSSTTSTSPTVIPVNCSPSRTTLCGAVGSAVVVAIGAGVGAGVVSAGVGAGVAVNGTINSRDGANPGESFRLVAEVPANAGGKECGTAEDKSGKEVINIHHRPQFRNAARARTERNGITRIAGTMPADRGASIAAEMLRIR